MIRLCNKQAAETNLSTCSGETCSSVFLSIYILKQVCQMHILPFVWLENTDSYTLKFHDKLLRYMYYKGALNNLLEAILDHQV